MTGRDFFKKFNWLINVFLKTLLLLPCGFRAFLFSACAGVSGRHGLFLRFILFKSIAKSCGDNVYIGRWCTLKSINNLTVGDNVSIHEYCYLDASGSIDIGNDVSIAHNASILSFEHSFDVKNCPIKYQPLKLIKVSIGDNVWLGCGVRVLAGSLIKSNTVVGANSVVKNEIGEGVFVGVVAKKVKDIG